MDQGAREVTAYHDAELDPEMDPIAADPDASDPEVEELVEGIETTREEMTLTVEEIGDRLDPKNIVAGAAGSVRDATVGKVEDMANTAGEMVNTAGETAREAGTGLMETIRRNPIPAALAGIGLGWLAMSARSQGGSGSRSRPGYAGGYRSGRYGYGSRGYGSGGTDYASGTNYASETGYDSGWNRGSGSEDPMARVQRRAGDMAEQAGETVDQVRDQVGRMADEVPYRVQSTARQAGDQVGRMYQDNPLAVGAIAVAVGTAIGLALPATQIERSALGEPARKVMDRAEDTASDALGKAEQTARDAEQEARKQDAAAKPH